MSSSDGGILAEGETSSETSRGSDDSPPCDLSLVERLLLTHPVWFLPGIQRSGAVHFLQGKEEGVSSNKIMKNKKKYEIKKKSKQHCHQSFVKINYQNKGTFFSGTFFMLQIFQNKTVAYFKID